jgi:hypothetical protein
MSNLCPGYRPFHLAQGGRCCCGLHWRREMPLHTERGDVVKDPEKYLKKLRKRS